MLNISKTAKIARVLQYLEGKTIHVQGFDLVIVQLVIDAYNVSLVLIYDLVAPFIGENLLPIRSPVNTLGIFRTYLLNVWPTQVFSMRRHYGTTGVHYGDKGIFRLK